MIDRTSAAYQSAKDRVKISWFTERGYDIRGIVHVGANDGYEVQYYAQMGIHRIVCFEPLPDAISRFMVKNAKSGAVLVHAALGNFDGEARLHVTPGDGQGSSLLPEKPPDRYQDSVVAVPVRRFASYTAEVGPVWAEYNALVIDTQGTELDVLRGMDDYLAGFELLSVECSSRPIYKGGAFADEVIAYLARFGFSQCTPTEKHDDIMFVRSDILKPDHAVGVIAPVIPPPMKPPTGNKLNCGSGQRPFDREYGWINVDSNPRWNPDLVADWNNLTVFPDASMDLVVSHHSLEHVGCGEGDGFIREANRVLKPGGSLLVFVPNNRELCVAFMDGKINEYIFNVNMYGAYMGDEADRHKWSYSAQGLVDYLRRVCPWSDVHAFNWRQIAGADLARDWWILGMEAVK